MFELQGQTSARLRYGAVGEFEIASFNWPDLPATKRAEVDDAAMLRFWGAAASLFQNQQAN